MAEKVFKGVPQVDLLMESVALTEVLFKEMRAITSMELQDLALSRFITKWAVEAVQMVAVVPLVQVSQSLAVSVLEEEVVQMTCHLHELRVLKAALPC